MVIQTEAEREAESNKRWKKGSGHVCMCVFFQDISPSRALSESKVVLLVQLKVKFTQVRLSGTS